MFCAPHYVVKQSTDDQALGIDGQSLQNGQKAPTASRHIPLSGTAAGATAVAAYKAPQQSIPSGSAATHGVKSQLAPGHALPLASAVVGPARQLPGQIPSSATGPPAFAARQRVADPAAAAESAIAGALAGDVVRCSVSTPYPEAPYAPAATELAGTTASDAAAGSSVQLVLPSSPLAVPAAATEAAALTAAAPSYPVDYWEDRYQLPYASARSHWPDPALLHLLTQQSDCLYDFNLPAVLPPATAAAAADGATRVSNSAENKAEPAAAAAAAASSSDSTPVLLPLSVPESLQQYTSSTAALATTCSGGGRLTGAQLLQIVRDAAVRTAALTAGGTAAAAAAHSSGIMSYGPQEGQQEPQQQQQRQRQQRHQQQQQQQPACFADAQLSSRYLLRLACPQLMVEYQSEWLQVPPSYLPLWRQLGLSAVSPAKTLIYTAIAPSTNTTATAAFFRDLSVMYSSCQLGVMSPMQPTDGPPLAPATAAAAAGQPSFPAGFGMLDSTAAAIIPVDTAASSSSTYGTITTAETGSSGEGAAAVNQSCWLRNLAAAVRSLQARLVLQPPDLSYSAPWVVPSPDLTQPQEASLVIFVVVPDNDMTVTTQEGGWPAAAAGAPGQQQQQHGESAAVLALRSYETVARYLAPLIVGVTATHPDIKQDHSLQPPQQPAAADGSVGAAAAAGQQQQEQQGHGLDIVIQVVRQSVALCPSERTLRGLAMSVFTKVRRRRSPALTAAVAAADASNKPASQQQQQQSPQQQQQSHPEPPAAAATAAAAAAEHASAAVPPPPADAGGLAAAEGPTSVEGVNSQPQPAAAAPSPGVQGDPRVLAPWVLSSPTYTSARTAKTTARPLDGQPVFEPLTTLAPAAETPPPAAGRPPATAEPPAESAAAAAAAAVQETAGKEEGQPVHAAAAEEGVQQQQQQQQQRQGQRQRTMHCCYYWLPQTGFTGDDTAAAAAATQWLVLTWTDDRAELMNSKLIHIPNNLLLPAAAAAAVNDDLTTPPMTAAAGNQAATAVAAAPALSRWVCGTVLAECLSYAADISSSVSSDRAVFNRLLISRLGRRLADGEADTWQTLLTTLQHPKPDVCAALGLSGLNRTAIGLTNGCWGHSVKVEMAPTPSPAAVHTVKQQQQQKADVPPEGHADSSTDRQGEEQQHCLPAGVSVAAAGGSAPSACDDQGTWHQLSDPTPDTGGHHQQQHRPQSTTAAADVWSSLLQRFSAGLSAVAAAATPTASRKRSRPGSTSSQQQKQQANGGGSSSSKYKSKLTVLSDVDVVTLLPDGPLYLGGSIGGNTGQEPLLLLPGLHQQQQLQVGSGSASTASIILPLAAAAADSLLPGETDTVRLVHVGVVAAAAAVTPAKWAAAAAGLSTSTAKTAGIQVGRSSLARGSSAAAAAAAAVYPGAKGRDGFEQLTVSVPQQTVGVGGPAAAAAADTDQQHPDLNSIVESLVDQLSPINPASLGLSPGAFLDSPLEGLVASGGVGEVGFAISDSAAAGEAAAAAHQQEDGELLDAEPDPKRQRIKVKPIAEDSTQQHQQQQKKNRSGGVDDRGTTPVSNSRVQNPPAAAFVTSAAAELAALSVAGMGLHGLLGYDGCAAAAAAAAGAAAACDAQTVGGLLPTPGSAVHLPLHATAALRLWKLATALDEVAS